MRTLQTQLIDKGIANAGIQREQTISHIAKKTQEKLTQKEWKDIMGCNRDTFTRGKGGAIRRR